MVSRFLAGRGSDENQRGFSLGIRAVAKEDTCLKNRFSPSLSSGLPLALQPIISIQDLH